MRAFFIHELARCESTAIGEGTRIWAFAHILPGASIGADCNISDHVFIENDVIIGDRVTVKCGVQLWDGVRIEDDAFIGPNATFSNDVFPRSKQPPEEFLRTLVGRGASIGSNATILPGIVLGAECMVGAGAVVTESIPPKAIVAGNPARISGYVATPASSSRALLSDPGSSSTDDLERRVDLGVGAASLWHIPSFRDMRGSLIAAEMERDLPFLPVRIFSVYDVPSYKVRGEHAHRECHQLLIATRGAVSVVVDDSTVSREVRLDRPYLGLHIPPRVWAIQYQFTPDAVLLVLASHAYDAGDYIRDYDEFLSIVHPG